MKWTTVLLSGVAVLAIACKLGDIVKSPPPPPPPGALVIRSERDTSVTADTLRVGGNVWLRVSGVDTTAAVTWLVNDTMVTGVAEQHHARLHLNARKVGSATVSASLDGRSGSFGLVVQQQSQTNHPPVARMSGPTSTVTGKAVTFDGTSSSDPDHDVLRYAWSFGDGSSNDSASIVMHTYTDAGTRTVRLIVTDPAALADTASLSITVSQAVPSINGYDMIDLGTLGGTEADPRALNDNDDVVGCSTTASGQMHAFLWTQARMRDLAPSTGTTCAQTITNSGLIAGTSGEAIDDNQQVVMWNNGVQTQLGSLYTEGPITVVALNGHGDIVAHRDDEGHSFESALWKNGVKQSLGGFVAAGPSALAYAMNDKGQIVGYSPVDMYKGDHIDHAFIWENGVMRDLGVLTNPPCEDDPTKNCGYAKAVAINNGGQIVGFSLTGSGSPTGIMWANGTMRDLGFPYPVAINDAGDIAGDTRNAPTPSGNPSNGPAYFWHQGSARQIGSLSGRTQVVGMNGGSIVTGWSVATDNNPHVFVWKPGDAALTDLGVGPPTAHAIAAFAVAINERGDILGRTFGSCPYPGTTFGSCDAFGGPSHAVLWRKR